MAEGYDLKEPIKIGDKETGGEVSISKVKIEKFRAKHFIRMPDDFLTQAQNGLRPKDFIPIAAAVTGLEEDIVGEMCVDDLTEIVRRSEAFLAESPEDGDKHSG